MDVVVVVVVSSSNNAKQVIQMHASIIEWYNLISVRTFCEIDWVVKMLLPQESEWQHRSCHELDRIMLCLSADTCLWCCYYVRPVNDFCWIYLHLSPVFHFIFQSANRYIWHVSLLVCSVTLALAVVGHWGMHPAWLPTINFFQLTLELHKVWHTLCAVASRNMFVFCNSNCSSSVAATWTLLSVLFCVILCATKSFM